MLFHNFSSYDHGDAKHGTGRVVDLFTVSTILGRLAKSKRGSALLAAVYAVIVGLMIFLPKL